MDLWAVRIVIVTLAAVVVACIIGLVSLELFGRPAEPALVSLASAGVGGMLGLLRPDGHHRPKPPEAP